MIETRHLLLIVLALAGCVSDPPGIDPPLATFPVDAGRVPPGEETLTFRAPVVAIEDCDLTGDFACFEPSVIDAGGGVLLASNGYGGRLARSDDDGAVWIPLLAARPLEQPLAAGGDALLQRAPDGSVWHSALLQTGVQLARSDDAGITWDTNTIARFGDPVDRNWLAFGDGVVVVHVQGEDGVRAVASTDGGARWSEPTTLVAGSAIHGHGASADGRMLVPAFDYDAREVVTFATRDGLTWDRIVVSRALGDFFPTLAAEGATVYAAWKTSVGDMLLASSSDAGSTWSAPAYANLPGERAAGSPWLVARDGKLAILYFVAADENAPADLRALVIEGTSVERGILARGIANNGLKEERPGNTDHAHGELLPDGRIATVYADATGRILFVSQTA